MGTQAQALRALFNKGEFFFAADCYTALTARIVQHVGFKAAYIGGQALGAMHQAIPDIGILSQVEQFEQAARIVRAIDIPLIVDADTLGETVADAFRYTRLYEQAGIAGFHVEDEINPKHSKFDNGLLSIADMQAKLDACVRARRDPAFLIIARCDEMYASAKGGGGTGSFDEAVKRGNAYAEAGADAICFATAPPEMTVEFARAVRVPIVPLASKQFAGARFAMSTGWGWTGAARLHWQNAQALMNDTLTYTGNPEDIKHLFDVDLYGDLVGSWAKKTSRPTR